MRQDLKASARIFWQQSRRPLAASSNSRKQVQSTERTSASDWSPAFPFTILYEIQPDRIFIAVVVSIAFLWLWAAVAPKVFPNLIKPRTTVTTPKPANTNKAANSTTTKTTTEPSPAVAAQQTPTAPPVPIKPTSAESVAFTSIDTPEYDARFSNRGTVLVFFQLKY